MISIRFEIRLKEPLLATAVEGDPNSSVSLPYIPGSLIRGALVSRYLRSHSTADLATDPQARRLFFNGETCFLNGYPADDGDKRALPTPASWYKEKGSGDEFTAYDLSLEKPDEEAISHPVQVAKPFCTLDDDGVATLYEPRKQITIHTQRDRVLGRATEGSGAIFQYEALAAGQTFIGFVLCSGDETANAVVQLFQEGDIFMGGSRSAGYGMVEIKAQTLKGKWREAPNQEMETIQAGDIFSLTLLSNAILRDGNGHYTGFLTPEILQTGLGVSLTLLDDYTFSHSGIVGGFNRKWGLPLPQVPVARAGSIYTFCAESDIPVDKLQSLLDNGIGERRAEGFGRVALHWNQSESVDVREPVRGHLPPVKLDESSKSVPLARRMANHILRLDLDAQLTARVNKLRLKGDIKNNQLSTIRILVRGARLSGDVQPILDRLKGMKVENAGRDRVPRDSVQPILDRLKGMKDTARKQFENARVGGQRLNEWIEGLLAKNGAADTVWQGLYQTSFDEDNLPAVGGVRAEWGDETAHKYALRLIDGVLSRALENRRAEK